MMSLMVFYVLRTMEFHRIDIVPYSLANWANCKSHFLNHQKKEQRLKKQYMICLSSLQVKEMKKWIMTSLQLLTIRR